MNAVLAGSVAAAFAAGMVAFFAPCCAGVMMPAYLAAIGAGHRFRVARLTAVYVAGVAVVVLPITLGAAALSSYITAWHAQMFAIGGLMMIAVAVMLWRGTMLPVNVPQPRMTGSAITVLGLGMFSGGATACCAPVLAGAIALSAATATIVGGLVLGAAYVAGMMTPLVPVALVYGKTKDRVRDPKIRLRLGRHTKTIGVVRLVGVTIFAAFGVLFVALALTGNADTAPAFQKVIGAWMRTVAAYVGRVPNYVAFPVLVLLLGSFVFAVVKKEEKNHERNEGAGDAASCDAPRDHAA